MDLSNMSSLFFSCPFYWELHNALFNKIKTDIDLINMDDSQRLSWLFTYETYKKASYLEKAWRKRKKALQIICRYLIVLFCSQFFCNFGLFFFILFVFLVFSFFLMLLYMFCICFTGRCMLCKILVISCGMFQMFDMTQRKEKL